MNAQTAATWTVSEAGVALRRFDVPPSEDAAVTLWGLAPERSYDWDLSAGDVHVSGTVATGPLPADMANLRFTTTGEAQAVDAVLVPAACDDLSWVVLVGADGLVRWFQPIEGGEITGLSWTDRDTALVIAGTTIVAEIAASGEELWRIDGFGRPVHHDLFRGGDHVYVLNAEQVGDRVIDGLYVIDDGTPVATWNLADHVPVSGVGPGDPFWSLIFPGADDWSHANSVWSDGKTALVSLRWLDAVVQIEADPASSRFGDLDWTLVGAPESPLPSDFTWPDGGGFLGQHHATPIPGGIAVFDNETRELGSRALEISLDGSEARELKSWPVGEFCDLEGGAFPLDGGGMLATCSQGGRVSEFPADSAEAVWTLTRTCTTVPPNLGNLLGRGIPVRLSPGEGL